MSIATRISALVIGVAVVMAALAIAVTASTEYQLARRQVVLSAEATVLSRPDLQVAIYNRDEPALQRVLAGFLDSSSVSLAAARDSLGEVLAHRAPEGEHTGGLPPFWSLRHELPVTDVGLQVLDEDLQPADDGWWSAFLRPDRTLHLTLPVFTAVNPVQRGLRALDFYTALSEPAAKASRRVMGYVQLDITRQALLQSTQAAVARVAYISLSVIVLSGLVVIVLSRRITRGLSQLASLAEQVATGQVQQTVQIKADREITNVAQVLNRFIGGVSEYRRANDVGQRLLSMKVEERTSQLSQREQELDKAAEEITQTRDQLRQLSYYDSLTSLPNRRLFTEQLDLLLDLNERNGQILALLFLNLDNFQRINDSLGHGAGDLALREVGRRLTSCVRQSDRVAHHADTDRTIDVSRLGGDEFTVVLNQLDSVDSAALVAQRLVDALLDPMQIEGNEVVIKPSIGIAIAPRDGSSVEALLKAAGVAMHHAKASSHETVLYYDSEMDAVAVGRLQLEADLRRAVERKQLVLHYQPQVNTTNGAVAGAEALLRWEHPEHGLVPPLDFIPIAEEIGAIAELGNWVLEEVCRQLKALDESGLKLPHMSVNVSAFEFNNAFVQRVSQVLQRYGLAGERLELGLSEAIMTNKNPATLQGLQALRALGVRLAVDDFGMGYSPLAYLGHYPLDELKINRSFIEGCDSGEEAARLLVGIIALARSLRLDMVAEGVETEAQCRFLIDQGAQVMQGYLFSRPVPEEELRQLLSPWHFVEQVQDIRG